MSNPLQSRLSHDTDVVILGGGIAGLWLLNGLVNKGYHAILLEASALGSGQSIASQGIIHGGLKYALNGSLSAAAQAIATMPGRWRSCLAGQGDVDLRNCRVLSPCYYMWSDGGYRSRLKTFLGSKTLRGRIDAVNEQELPALFSASQLSGSLYRLEDFVVDTSSLLETLGSNMRERVFNVAPEQLRLPKGDVGTNGVELRVTTNKGELTLCTRRIVLTAGEGNQNLMASAELTRPTMQTRPLNMVMLRAANLPEAFVHCVGDNFSLTPVLTITTHGNRSGERVWYLGGELAESGVHRSDNEQIEAANALLRRLFPSVDLSGAEWACLRINRAEGQAEGQHRPDSVFYRSVGNYLVAWPTKFTLSPALTDQIAEELAGQQIFPRAVADFNVLRGRLESARVAVPPWEVAFA